MGNDSKNLDGSLSEASQNRVMEGEFDELVTTQGDDSALEADRFARAVEAQDEASEAETEVSAVETIRLPKNDPLYLYLKQINPYPLLTKEQELELAERIRQGDRQAHERMVNSNLKLVVSIARKHLSSGLSFLDLIQEGNLGLLKAVDWYDPTKGYRFSTYATWWIRNSVSRAIANQSRPVRLPLYAHQLVSRLLSLDVEYAELEPKARDTILKQELNIDQATLEHLRTIALHPKSLQEPDVDYDEGDLTVADTLEDSSAAKAIDGLISNVDNPIAVAAVLALMLPREVAVVKLHYGFEGVGPMTLERVGSLMGFTRERARQILGDALNKARRYRALAVISAGLDLAADIQIGLQRCFVSGEMQFEGLDDIFHDFKIRLPKNIYMEVIDAVGQNLTKDQRDPWRSNIVRRLGLTSGYRTVEGLAEQCKMGVTTFERTTTEVLEGLALAVAPRRVRSD